MNISELNLSHLTCKTRDIRATGAKINVLIIHIELIFKFLTLHLQDLYERKFPNKS